ncbi:MAG: PDZ domain-containing protein [Bryobacteraceae bacterium]
MRLVVLATAFGIGIYSQAMADPYSTGMTLISSTGCPIFVAGVVARSPAERARIHAGDQVLMVDGTPVRTLNLAVRLLRSDRPEPVNLRLARNGKEFEAVLGREKRSTIFANAGERIVSGLIVPPDMKQAEIDRILNFQGHRIVGRVFPSHYPRNPEVFYAGFEIFILRDPAQVTVGGIENGPAAKAGVHWGDVLVSANGIATLGKTQAQLEALFSAKEPATMHLLVDRLGVQKILDFRLEKAEEIARQNAKRFANCQIVPAWVSEKYLHCFLKSPSESNPR